MPRPRTVRCSYVGNCTSRRGVQGRISRDRSYLCDSCGLYFCLVHSHLRPSARPSQYCHHHDQFHPTCWVLTTCNDCQDNACDAPWHARLIDGLDMDIVNFDPVIPRTRSRQNDSVYHGVYQDPRLDFSGVAGSHPLGQGARFVGLEIEAERGGHFTLPDRFGITIDGSLSRNGIEVLTPPSRGEALVENVTIAMDTLSRAGYEATSNCGLHAHFDLRDKKNDKRFLSRLFAIGFATEDVLYSLQECNRHEGEYCKPLRSEYPFYCARGPHAEDFEFVYNKADKNDRYDKRRVLHLRGNKWGNRYLGFNFHSVFYRGTLENRIHEGTLDAERILQWTDLMQSLIKRADDRISYADLLGIMNAEDRIEKIDKMGKVFSLTDDQMVYVYKQARKQLVEIPFGLNTVPVPTYL